VPAGARTLSAPARPGAAAAAVAAAVAGDTVELAAGVHAGPIVVDRPLIVRGAGATIDGGGRGTVVTVTAPGAVLEGLAVRASGKRVLTVDSGVRVSAAGVTLRDLELSDVLYGIYGERASGLRVERCTLRGRVRPLDETGEGNGIHLWYTDDAVVLDGDVERFADGVYLSFANRARVRRTRLHDNGRYGLHTMYCQATRLEESVFTRNVAGCAIMFSNRLEVRHNDFVHNRGPRTYGLLLRDCSEGRFEHNRLVDNTVAAFLDNSNRNHFESNLLQDNGWGLLVFSSCAGNVFAGNAFLNDDYPVALDMRRTSNRFDDGRRGNYWSSHAAYDLDGNGVGDTPFDPVTTFAFVSKRFPDLAVLASSPAVAALAVAERVFPALSPSRAVDRFPLVTPPPLAKAGAGAEAGLPAPRPALGAAAGFLTLAAAGAAGVLAGRRS
jgi:nitrous oxidase accessory protein